jgi:hypothetical protein
MARRSRCNKATATTVLVLIHMLVLNCGAVPSPILDFLDPFLNQGDRHNEIGGSGGLAAAGHVGAGLGNSIGFNADGSVAASKGFGVGVDKNTGLDFNPDRHPHFQGDEVFDEHVPLIGNKHHLPPPPLQKFPEMVPSVPCKHPLPRPLASHPPPPNQRKFLKQARSLLDKAILQKKVNNATKNATTDHSDTKRAIPILVLEEAHHNKSESLNKTSNLSERSIPTDPNQGDSDIEGFDVDNDGDIDDDDVDFLRQARSLLDKAILKKMNNVTNDTASNEHSTVKRSIPVPVLVLEEVHFAPLNKSSSHNETMMLNERRSIPNNSNSTNSIDQESSHQQNNATIIDAKNSTSNKTKEDEREISPKFAHMFHNMFAG